MTKPSPQKHVAWATTNRRLLTVLSYNCPELAKTENIHQNYNVATYTHWRNCRKYNTHKVDKWHKHNLKTVEERNAIDILCGIPTPKKYILTDVAIPSDKNTFTQEPEKTIEG